MYQGPKGGEGGPWSPEALDFSAVEPGARPFLRLEP